MISLSLPVLYPYVYIQPLSSKTVKPSPPHPYPAPSNTQQFTLHCLPWWGMAYFMCTESIQDPKLPAAPQSIGVSNTKTHRDSL